MYRYCMIYVDIVPEYPFFFPAHQPLFAPRHRTAAAACDPRADATPSPRHLRRVRADLRRRQGRPGRAARRVGRPTPVTGNQGWECSEYQCFFTMMDFWFLWCFDMVKPIFLLLSSLHSLFLVIIFLEGQRKHHCFPWVSIVFHCPNGAFPSPSTPSQNRLRASAEATASRR